MLWVGVIFGLAVFAKRVVDHEFYNLLDVTTDADSREIKKAFRTLAKEYHPDTNSDKAETDMFSRISEAYDVLSNPELREKYDKGGREALEPQGRQGGGGNGFPFDGFSGFGGFGGFGGGDGSGKRVAEPVEVTVPFSLEDAVEGLVVDIHYSYSEPCDTKGCTVIDHSCTGPCSRVHVQQINFNGQMMKMQQQAFDDKCIGRGEAVKPNCGECPGGKRILQGKIPLTLKAGFDERSFRMMGKGNRGRCTEKGPLDIKLMQVPHPIFRRDGYDLHADLNLRLGEAIAGFRVEMKDIQGKDKVITGQSALHGERIIKKRQGMRNSTSGVRGDLILTVNLEMPKDLPESDKKRIAEILETHESWVSLS